MSLLRLLNVEGKLAIEHTTPGEGTWTLALSLSAFFNYWVLQYIIPVTSKPLLLCWTLVNLLGSHTFILTEYFFSNCGILTLLYCTLSHSPCLILWISLFSLLSFFSSLHPLVSKL